jgi:hypothetical protein
LVAFDKIMPLDRIRLSLAGNLDGPNWSNYTALGRLRGIIRHLRIYLNQIRRTPETMVRNLYNLSIGHVIPHFAQSAKEIT